MSSVELYSSASKDGYNVMWPPSSRSPSSYIKYTGALLATYLFIQSQSPLLHNRQRERQRLCSHSSPRRHYRHCTSTCQGPIPQFLLLSLKTPHAQNDGMRRSHAFPIQYLTNQNDKLKIHMHKLGSANTSGFHHIRWQKLTSAS